MSDTYILTATGGMRQHFIASIIIGLHVPNFPLTQDFGSSNVHHNYVKYKQKVFKQIESSMPTEDSYKYAELKKNTEESPLIFIIPQRIKRHKKYTNYTDEYEFLIQKFNRKIHHLIFTCTKEECMEIELNHLYRGIRTFPLYIQQASLYWTVYETLHSKGMIGEIDNLNQLTNEESKLLINTYTTVIDHSTIIVDEFKKCSNVTISEIKYGDIESNPEKIIKFLEQLTNKVRDDRLMTFYYEYLETQKRFKEQVISKII